MAQVLHTHDDLETLALEDEASDARVCIAPARGGMVTRFSVGGRPVLFLDESTLRDPRKNVRGGIPILFPIAGKLPFDRYERDGRTFVMKQHGFARDRPWAVIDEAASPAEGACVTLELEASESTRDLYPFEFAVRFSYRLHEGVLTIERWVENRSATAMPVQDGIHPYFFVPDGTKSQTRIDTDATRAIDNRTGLEVAVASPIALADGEVDLHLLDHHPRETVLHRVGLPDVRIGFDRDQAVLVVWTLPGRDFVCVEPWRAPAGALAAGTAPEIDPRSSATTTTTLSLASLTHLARRD